MDRHRGTISKLFFDPEDGTKLSERGKCLVVEARRLVEHGKLLKDFRGTVAFYEDVDGNVGYEVSRQGEDSFVELGFTGLRDAITHFVRFGSKPEDETNDTEEL